MLVGGLWALISLAPSLTRGIRASLAARARPRGERRPAAHRATSRSSWSSSSRWSRPPRSPPLLSLRPERPAVRVHGAFVPVAGFPSSAVAAHMAGLPAAQITPSPASPSRPSDRRAPSCACSAPPQPAPPPPSSSARQRRRSGDGRRHAGPQGRPHPRLDPSTSSRSQAVGVVAAVFVMAPILTCTTPTASLARPGRAPGRPWPGGGRHLPANSLGDDLDRRRNRGGDHRLDLWLASRASSFRTPVLAFAVGITAVRAA
jgi:hypothetical protein